jgi:hypothetical protein
MDVFKMLGVAMDRVAERKGPPRFSSLISNEKEKDKALTYPSTEKELDLYASKEVGQQAFVFYSVHWPELFIKTLTSLSSFDPDT